MTLKGTSTHQNLKDAFAGESPGQPPLSLFRQGRRRRGLPRGRRQLPLRPPKARRATLTATSTTSSRSRRSRHRPEPIGDTIANLKSPWQAKPTSTPRCTPGMAKHRSRRGLRRDRRLVRDPRQGREVPRQAASKRCSTRSADRRESSEFHELTAPARFHIPPLRWSVIRPGRSRLLG